MCEQTEISYLDGDIVWVKLGACWWPGQVTGFHNLPEDIQDEFQRKPLIAAVKFFQEDTYEFVKNYQQIYKYNCTLKDEFIKKGLDKYRSKSKDGTSYMDKFPGDVEMAEKLTGGDPDILNQDKFSPEEKPDISALFGDKKIPKKKRDRDDAQRRSDRIDIVRKITHPRFLKESDHEVRIRQQPSSLPSTPNSGGSPQYPCHLCSFTSSRVNVIICHIKSHRSGGSPMARTKIKTYSQQKVRISDTDTPKRKYVRKEKSQSHKNKTETGIDTGKRKQTKQNDKASKKKKTDPELREKLLADWDDESDEDLSLNQTTPLDISSIISPTKEQSNQEDEEESNQKNNIITDNNEIIEGAEKLLKETEKLTSIHIMDESLTGNVNISKNIQGSIFDKKSEFESDKVSDHLDSEPVGRFQKEKETSNSDNEGKHLLMENEDKKARLSCFDFDEDDMPEPSIPPVRKIPRLFGEKNLSLKKEIIKEFEMSQAMKTEQEKENDNEKAEIESPEDLDANSKNSEISSDMQSTDSDQKSMKIKKSITVADESHSAKKGSGESKKPDNDATLEEDQQKSTGTTCETELEIVEIFEVERDEADNELNSNTAKDLEKELQETIVEGDTSKTAAALMENNELHLEGTSISEKKEVLSKDTVSDNVLAESTDHSSLKEIDETLSERFTTETEDETISESADTFPDQSETSDTEMVDLERTAKPDNENILLSAEEEEITEQMVKKRRGRPRKNAKSVHTVTGKNEALRIKSSKLDKKIFGKINMERKTSESDTERSYSGRKRKPNKKYLESDIYVQDTDQRAFKTDESQSEGEDRTSERAKGKSRRSTKSGGVSKKKTESTSEIEEKEIELSQQTLNITEKNTTVSKIDVRHDSSESSSSKGKSFSELDKKLIEAQIDFDFSEKTLILKDEESSMSKPPDTESPSGESKSPITDDSDTTITNLKSQLTHASDKAEAEDLLKQNEFSNDSLQTTDSSCTNIQVESSLDKIDNNQASEVFKTAVEMLPPKKSQRKKFELSQIDFFDSEVSANKVTGKSESEKETVKAERLLAELAKGTQDEQTVDALLEKDKSFIDTSQVDSTSRKTTDKVTIEKGNSQQGKEILSAVPEEGQQVEKKSLTKIQVENNPEVKEETSKDTLKTLHEQQPLKRSSMQTRYKGKFTPETGTKPKKDKDMFLEEKPVNTFQEAFLKTLQMDKKKGAAEDADTAAGKGRRGKKLIKKKLDEQDDTDLGSVLMQDTKLGSLEENMDISENIGKVQSEETISRTVSMTNFEGVEVVVEENPELDAKSDSPMFQNAGQLTPSSADFGIIGGALSQSSGPEDGTKAIGLDMQKVDESSRISASTPSPSSDVTVPVKKREMPRIIENIPLTEPVQILKSKLLDKLPQKGVKHKFDSEGSKKGDPKGSPKAKIMKIESPSSNSKMRTGLKVTSPHLSLTKKLQVLKAEEAEAAAIMEAQNEQLNAQTSQSSTATGNEKYIQQSTQSLADMELDINSMPFVLSEDVLTPESIQQMPVVISSIIPSSSSIPATLSFTPTTQVVTHGQPQFKLTGESAGESSPSKKKSGTPAILKNKNKAKPTITSIKTLVPPLTGGVKGIKFQSSQGSKTPPVLTQKGTPGKYVVVQTAGGQQLRYSVQGKTSTQQKIAIPTGKSGGNAQVLQQGGKVVILTSAQSGQTKMLPLNMSKTLSGKVQRIMTSKSQVFCPINPQSIITSKTIIAPKGDGVTPTTSKLAPAHKIINTQGIITSKSVLTQIPGTIAKTALLGTLSQGILTKDGIYTPISASSIGGKTIIGSKTLITKGATILSSQNLGSSKTILAPISQTLGGKTILSAQGIVNAKGTVLTPITGQQVKAIAAKSPTKGSKVQYQSVQQKVQLPMLQKSQKVPLSSSTQGRSLKTSSNTLVLQNTGSGQKSVQHGKKLIKQTIVQGATVQGFSSSGNAQQTVGLVSQFQPKGHQKMASTSTVQKVIIPRGTRHPKAQQKIIVQKVQEPTMTQVQNIQSKQTLSAGPANVSAVSKSAASQKHSIGSTTAVKAGAKSHVPSKTQQQSKNLLNIAMNSVTASNLNANISTSLSLPPLEPIEPEKKKVDTAVVDTAQKDRTKVEKFNIEKGNEVEKVEEPKLAAQPQIMALPTESSDGTQTYVLVTIDEQGQIQPLDNNTLMSLEGTTQNPDGTRTLYIDPSSLGEAGTLDNIVLQFDNGVLPNVQTSIAEPNQTIISESFPTSEVIQTSNQDILAAALANTDFQQEISLSENPTASVMTTGLTQTSLINQTILQSTIIPPTEPISSPSVLETSLTLNQPIMTPLEVPSNLPIQSDSAATSVVSSIPSSLELPITITNPSISYISTGEAQIQIPGNSMPDIGEIMESPATSDITHADIPASTQYLVIPSLEDNITVETQSVQSGAMSLPTVSYSVSIPNNIVLQNPQVQTTPSMPIIDDTYSESVQFTTSMESSMAAEQTFVDVPVSEMLVSKAPTSTESVQSHDVTVTSEMMIVSNDVPATTEESVVATDTPLPTVETEDVSMPLKEAPVTSEEMTLSETVVEEDTTCTPEATKPEKEAADTENVVDIQITEQMNEPMTSSMPIIDESSLTTSDANEKIGTMNFGMTDSCEIENTNTQEAEATTKFEQLTFDEQADDKVHSPAAEQQAATSVEETTAAQEASRIMPSESPNHVDEQSMEVEENVECKTFAVSTVKHPEESPRDEPTSQGESSGRDIEESMELQFEEPHAETSQEAPSQSYEQFGISMTSDAADLPSQSATKAENSREPSQSVAYEPMEVDEEAVIGEPPSQSFEHSKISEPSQSYEASAEASTNAPTQSFNELMQSQDERSTVDEAIDDQAFPTQSYEVGKADNIPENLETDAEISQEGNIPSQSNDIGTDCIGTSSVSTNNSGLNEDETASSSYVPETPENQERDQDQESAISTSSYEIPPCEELNIASSSVIPDTSVRTEHTSIHDNGVPEIPTSSYNLNPDISSTHVDSVPTSSYEDQVIVEQNVSTSYEVPISMPGLEETCSQNFVTESTDHRNEPSSYYAHHQEVTASYYESVDQETNSRLEGDAQGEVTPSYYEANPQEASQSYFTPEEATPSYSSHNVSPNYYDPRPESEASQSYYSTNNLEKTEQSSSQNIEASQSFYQEQSDELKLRQQGEATPTYSERYPVDYTLDNSPIERHDLVESSVPATRPMER
ncbi:hypothetical protein KM043_013601 [Ampulex compressa]|nr:hypothetical protein KM043_013601 [Ampulex compressa]